MTSIHTVVRVCSGSRRLGRWSTAVALLGLGAACSSSGCSSGTGPSAGFPAAPFSAMTTDSGTLRVEVRTSPQPPSRGGIDAELTVTDATTGAPRDGLTLQIRPWMPAMNHGAIMATVMPEGNGKYLVTEVDLYMAGLWELRTTISGPISDHVAPQFEIR
jgi:YtkA-like